MKYLKCLRCGRPLKTEASQELGFGKICWDKFNSENHLKKLFEVSNNEDKEGDSC